MARNLFYLYLAILFVVVLIGLYNKKKFDSGVLIILVLITLSFVTEMIGVITALYYKTKNYVYPFYSIAELSLTSLYFVSTMRMKYKMRYIIAVLFPLIIGSVLMYFQPLGKFDSYMLIFESFFIILMALVFLYKLLYNDSITSVLKNVNFWIWTSLLIYWSGTFFYWPFLEFAVNKKNLLGVILTYWQIVINIIFYLSIGIIFLASPKLLKNDSKA